jgi:hypothetical protein
MWRTALSVISAALLGSVLATILYSSFLTFWEGGLVPSTVDDLRMLLIVSLAASFFTVPGALLLAAAEFVLFNRLRSERALDGALVALGALAGAAMLGVLNGREGALGFALPGAVYGLTTALLFCIFQHLLGSRRDPDFYLH